MAVFFLSLDFTLTAIFNKYYMCNNLNSKFLFYEK